MATSVELKTIEEAGLTGILSEARERLSSAPGELVLDLSAVSRVGAKGVGELEQFALAAQQKAVKVVLRGVNVNVYKVLKLIKLSSRFAFVN